MIRLATIRNDAANKLFSFIHLASNTKKWDSLCKCGGLDEFSRLQSIWEDPIYLYGYFKSKKSYLDGQYYNGIAIEDAVDRTLEYTERFFDLLMDDDLDSLFVTLSDKATSSADKKHKYKIKEEGNDKNWLRIYALKIAPGVYVITGGAIKLWKEMKLDVVSKTELAKIDIVADFLKEEGVVDTDSLEAYVMEEEI